MRIALAAVLYALFVGGALAQTDGGAPPECRPNAAGQVDHEACVRAAAPGTPWRTLALINLGSDAFMRDDYAAAVRYYDEARPGANQQLLSDIVFHTFRGASYWRVGRREDALQDADVVYRMLQRDPTLQVSPQDYIPAGLNEELIYVYMLPVLQAGDPQRFQTALQAFRALPATSWESYGNRAAALQEIGDLPGALDMSGRALAQAPNDPGVLNNHCYILLKVGRAVEALPFCERAVRAVPNIAAVRHSLAEVLAALGRCAEAEHELGEARRLDPVTIDYQQPLTCSAN
jgi:tetratricopeptide (TPR) repeat protein